MKITEAKYKIRTTIPPKSDYEKSFDYEENELTAQIDADEDPNIVLRELRNRCIRNTAMYRKEKEKDGTAK